MKEEEGERKKSHPRGQEVARRSREISVRKIGRKCNERERCDFIAFAPRVLHSAPTLAQL